MPDSGVYPENKQQVPKEPTRYNLACKIAMVLALFTLGGGIIRGIYNGGWKDIAAAIVAFVVLMFCAGILNAKGGK